MRKERALAARAPNRGRPPLRSLHGLEVGGGSGSKIARFYSSLGRLQHLRFGPLDNMREAGPDLLWQIVEVSIAGRAA